MSFTRLLSLAVVLFAAIWSTVFCKNPEDIVLKYEDCGSPVLEVLKNVQHGPAFAGGKLRATVTLRSKKAIQGGTFIITVSRKFFGLYLSFSKYEGLFCELIHKEEGCKLQEGEVLSYDIEAEVPAIAPRGKYHISSEFYSDGGKERWSCGSVEFEIVKIPSGTFVLIV